MVLVDVATTDETPLSGVEAMKSALESSLFDISHMRNVGEKSQPGAQRWLNFDPKDDTALHEALGLVSISPDKEPTISVGDTVLFKTVDNKFNGGGVEKKPGDPLTEDSLVKTTLTRTDNPHVVIEEKFSRENSTSQWVRTSVQVGVVDNAWLYQNLPVAT